MRIRNLKIALIAPALLLILMGCMHFGDGHHTGYNSCYYYSEPPQKSLQSSPPSLGNGGMLGHRRIIIHHGSTDLEDQV